MLRQGPSYVDLREVVINGTTLVDCRKQMDGEDKYLDAQAFTVVTEWGAQETDYLKITPSHGPERSLTAAGSRAFQADRTYEQSLKYFRSSGANEAGFRIILHY